MIDPSRKLTRTAPFTVWVAWLLMLAPTMAQLTDSRLELQPVVSGLTLPTSLVFVGADDFLVSQKNDGRVLRVIGGSLQPGEVLDLNVNFRSEQGLLSMVRDPDFVHNGYIYLFYTESSTGGDSNADDTQLGNRVYRYMWNGEALVQPRLILDLPADTPFGGIIPGPHNGGAMTFGPDDHLYVLIGDLAHGNLEVWSGQLQNVATGAPPDDTGSILRVDRTGRAPRDNPFYNAGDPDDPVNRYFAYGIRNSFGIAFDPVTGELWQTENGPTDMDEVNRIFPGFNGGWIRIKGPVALDAEGPVDLWITPGAVYGDPEFVWTSPVAPTALAFVASRKLGCDLEHDMIVGDAVCRQLYKFELDASRQSLEFTAGSLQDKIADNQPDTCVDDMTELIFGSGSGLDVVTDLENGPDGRLYVVQYTSGTVTRIAPASGAVVDLDGDEVEDSCDCDATDSTAFALPVVVPTLRADSKPSSTLGWDGQAATAGSGTLYRVVSGALQDLPTLGYDAACTLEPGLGAPQTVDGRTPVTASGFYYLVEAFNGCGRSGFGDGSGVPDPRDTLDGSIPPACAGP